MNPLIIDLIEAYQACEWDKADRIREELFTQIMHDNIPDVTVQKEG